MLENLRIGLTLVMEVSQGFRPAGEWMVQADTATGIRWLFNPSRNLNFYFLEKPLAETLFRLPQKNNGPSGSFFLGLAFLLEKIKDAGYSQELAEDFLRYIASAPEADWPPEIADFMKLVQDEAERLETEGVHRFLVERVGKAWADELAKAATLDYGELKSVFSQRRTRPVIYLPRSPVDKNENANATLAQMCLHARKQGITEDSLFKHLLDYIDGIVKQIAGKDATGGAEVLEDMVNDWGVPLHRKSFNAYIYRRAKDLAGKSPRGKEILVDPSGGGLDCAKAKRRRTRSAPVSPHGKYTVDQAAEIIGCDRRTIYRWLEAGKIPGRQEQEPIITESVMFRQVSYQLDEEGLQQARELRKQRNERKDQAYLPKVIAEKNGIGLPAAWKRLRKYREKGLSPEEICRLENMLLTRR